MINSKVNSASDINAPIRVLIVDDSAFMRFTITKRLNETNDLLVVGAARNGEEALNLIPTLNPDVITMDVEMPLMDGMTALRQIMTTHPRPVIMLSSLTTEGARETIQALTLGAVDFIAKPSAKASIDSIIDELVAKIRRVSRAHVGPTLPVSSTPITPLPRRSETEPAVPAVRKITRPLTGREKVVVIGSSTGGPRALNTVVPQLSADLPAAFLIVQHMPVGFTRSLAERLDSVSKLAIKEAAPGDRLEVGRALLAPGGFHMTVDGNGQIALNQNPPVHGVRPSVDVTLAAVAQHYRDAAVAVILTGMGSDGTNGATLVRSAGGYVIAEDESTSVVWGMPRSVIEAGASDAVVALPDVAVAIEKVVKG